MYYGSNDKSITDMSRYFCPRYVSQYVHQCIDISYSFFSSKKMFTRYCFYTDAQTSITSIVVNVLYIVMIYNSILVRLRMHILRSFHLDWDGDTKVCLFKFCQKKTLFFGYPAIMALRAMKRQTLLPSLHWICLVPRLVYPTVILNIVSANIFFPLGKMIGTNFILSSQSWEIGSPPTGGAGRMKLSCVVPASVINICILTVRHILVECNHFARERKDIFGRIT